jgi:hypothetical protein
VTSARRRVPGWANEQGRSYRVRRERRQRQGAGSRHGRVRRAGQTGHGQRERQEAERTERQQVRQRWCLSRKSDGDAGCREAMRLCDLRVCLDVVVPTVRALTAFSRSPALTIAYDVRPDQGERTVVLTRRNRGPGAEIPARLKSAVELGDAAKWGHPRRHPAHAWGFASFTGTRSPASGSWRQGARQRARNPAYGGIRTRSWHAPRHRGNAHTGDTLYLSCSDRRRSH